MYVTSLISRRVKSRNWLGRWLVSPGVVSQLCKFQAREPVDQQKASAWMRTMQ